MKKILIILLTSITTLPIWAQNTAVDHIQSMYGMEKRSIVSKFLTLDKEQADLFWPIYDEYEVRRKELGKIRVDLLSQFENLNSELTDEKADELFKAISKLSKNNDKLIETYYKKVRKALGGVRAAQFYQIESYLLTAQRFAIQDNLPVVGGQLQ